MGRVIQRKAQGYAVKLPRDEREVVVGLMVELRSLLVGGDPTAEPLLRRLFPPAYHLAGDAAAEAEYQRYMREELVASRVAAITAVETALSADRYLDEAAMQQFMAALNSVRLVLGTVLDISEDDDFDTVAADDPLGTERQLYVFLSWLLENCVRAISGD